MQCWHSLSLVVLLPLFVFFVFFKLSFISYHVILSPYDVVSFTILVTSRLSQVEHRTTNEDVNNRNSVLT